MKALSRANWVGPVGAAIAIALSGCGTLSSTGPSVSTMKASPDVDIVNVTPALARTRAATVAENRQATVNRALRELTGTPRNEAFVFAPGDALHLSLWTISPWPGADSSQGASNGPTAIDLGDYNVSAQGSIDLPYAGTTSITGLGLAAAQNAIAGRYASLGILQSPSAKITVTSTAQGSIIVTGAVGTPKIIPWTPAGISLTAALTQALGNGADIVSSANGHNNDNAATEVSILRKNATINLPMEDALSHQIALEPGDRVLVKKAPLVRVTVLGGGAGKNGEYSYARVPTLAEVLASASGLDGNSADDHAVFVLEQRVGDTRPVLYDFAWEKVQGLVASHSFPMKDGDMVYVAEAPIVPVQRAINILFQLALPVQAVK